MSNGTAAVEQNSGYYERLAALIDQLMPQDISNAAIDATDRNKAPDQHELMVDTHNAFRQAVIDHASRHIVELLAGDKRPKMDIPTGESAIIDALNNSPNRRQNLDNANLNKIMKSVKDFSEAEAERIREGIAAARPARPALGAHTNNVISTSDFANQR